MRIDFTFLYSPLLKLLLLCILSLIAFPSIAISQTLEYAVNPAQGDYDVPKPIKELPYYIRSNCYAWVKYRYPNTPPTSQILPHLSSKGEIGVMISNGIYHYAVVEIDNGDTLTISDTNWGSDTKKVRQIKRTSFIGFYKL